MANRYIIAGLSGDGRVEHNMRLVKKERYLSERKEKSYVKRDY